MAKNICVYCGSSTSVEPHFLELAHHLGRRLGQQGHRLIWGGGSIGLMGALGRSAQQHGGKVTGVIPRFMQNTEVVYTQADELIVTESMAQRKAVMLQRGDGFIALPGGIGTLEEAFENITLAVLHQHAKPLVFLNHRGFYNPMLDFFEQLYDQRFLRQRTRDCYQVTEDLDHALSLAQVTKVELVPGEKTS